MTATTYRLVRQIDPELASDHPVFQLKVNQWARDMTAMLVAQDVVPTGHWSFRLIDEQVETEVVSEPTFTTVVVLAMEGTHVDQDANSS